MLPPWKKHGIAFTPTSACQKLNIRTTSSFPYMAAGKARQFSICLAIYLRNSVRCPQPSLSRSHLHVPRRQRHSPHHHRLACRRLYRFMQRFPAPDSSIIGRIISRALSKLLLHGPSGRPVSAHRFWSTRPHHFLILNVAGTVASVTSSHGPIAVSKSIDLAYRPWNVSATSISWMQPSVPAFYLKILNYCRLHLHVTTVSELFDADGLYVLPHIYQCSREPWFNPSQYITLQRRPSEHQIRHKWQRSKTTVP